MEALWEQMFHRWKGNIYRMNGMLANKLYRLPEHAISSVKHRTFVYFVDSSYWRSIADASPYW